MMDWRFGALALLLALFLVTPLAQAEARFEPYSAARLAQAQSEGRPVFVEVAARWCSTCKRQAPIIAALLAEPAFSNYVALKLDWDDEREAARALGAPRQSTLFVFKDGKRLAMSVAEVDPVKIRALLERGITS
jgi:thiol:disulfide interchange protein